MERPVERSLERSGEGGFWLEYVEASSNEMDIKIELSVLRNPRKHYSRPDPRTTHPPTQERYEKAFRRSVPPGRPAGHHLHTFIVRGNLRLQQNAGDLRKTMSTNMHSISEM